MSISILRSDGREEPFGDFGTIIYADGREEPYRPDTNPPRDYAAIKDPLSAFGLGPVAQAVARRRDLDDAQKNAVLQALEQGIAEGLQADESLASRTRLNFIEAIRNTSPGQMMRASLAEPTEPRPGVATGYARSADKARLAQLEDELEMRRTGRGRLPPDPRLQELPDAEIRARIEEMRPTVRQQQALGQATAAAGLVENARLLGRYAGLPGYDGVGEGAAAFIGTVAGTLIDPINFIPMSSSKGKILAKTAQATAAGGLVGDASYDLARQAAEATGEAAPSRLAHVGTMAAASGGFTAGAEALGLAWRAAAPRVKAFISERFPKQAAAAEAAPDLTVGEVLHQATQETATPPQEIIQEVRAIAATEAPPAAPPAPEAVTPPAPPPEIVVQPPVSPTAPPRGLQVEAPPEGLPGEIVQPQIGGFQVQPVRRETIAARPDLMQFKAWDESTSGVNAADRIDGEWRPEFAGLMTLWEPLNPQVHNLNPGQRYIVANGHHRLEFANRAPNAPDYLNVQILREADGYSAADARRIGAEINIADGKGSIYDQAKFFRDVASARGSEEAIRAGHAIGGRSRKAAAIGIRSSDLLFQSFINERTSADQAEAIALASTDEGLQRLGVLQAAKGRSASDIANFMRAVEAETASPNPTGEQLDLFGADDSAIVAAERMAARASGVQREVAEMVRSVEGASKRPDRAKALGVDINDPEGLTRRVVELKALRNALESWHTSPDLVTAMKADNPPREVVEGLLERFRQVQGGDLAAPLPVALKQGQSVVGGSIPREISAPVAEPPRAGVVEPDGQTGLFTGGETGGETVFNLAGETTNQGWVDLDAQAAATAAAKEAEKAQGQLFDMGSMGDSIDAAAVRPAMPARITAPPLLDPNAPVNPGDIRRYLRQALDVPVRLGVGRARAYGFYRTHWQAIRMKALNDIPTLAHEVGHYIHNLIFPGVNQRNVRDRRMRDYTDFGGNFDTELLPLGRVTSRQSYTRHQVRMEGVAEFTREWMFDRATARSKAPLFAEHWERELKERAPEVWQAMERGQEMIAKWRSQPSAVRVRGMISRKPVKAGTSFKERLQGLYDDWVNDLAPLERAAQRLIDWDANPATARAFVERAINYTGGWRGKAEHDLFHAQTDVRGAPIGESLRAIIGGLGKEELMEFGDYLAVRRAKELRSRGIESGFEHADIKPTIDLYEPRYEERARRLDKFQRNALQLLVDGGLISADAARKMTEQNQFYAPFYRLYEGPGGVSPGGTSRGFVNTPTGVRRIKGVDLEIIDPIESIVKNVYMFRDLAERNLVGQLFVSALQSTEGAGRLADPVTRKVKGTRVRDEEVRQEIMQWFKQIGMNPTEAKALLATADDLAFTIWRAARTEDPKKGIFKVMDGGVEQFYQTDDKEMLRSLMLMDRMDASLLSKLPLHGAMSTVTRVKRAGATLALEFIARNPFRDQMQAAIYSRYGFIPFWDGFRGVLSALKKDQWYQDWINAGGRYADFIASDRADLQRTLSDVADKPGAMRVMTELIDPRNVLRNLQRLSEFAEMGTRIGEFRRGVEAGAGWTTAANASKEIALNFSRAGFKGKVMNQIRAFFNASIQDMDKLVRMHIERPGHTLQKAATYITVPSIMLWYLNKDDEQIQSLPRWRKVNFWNINVTEFARAAGVIPETETLTISLPKPFLLGHLYGTSAEAALDLVYKRDPNAVESWFSDLRGMTPANATMIVPDLALPLIENSTNYSFFRKGPVVPDSMVQNLPPELRATPQTSQVGRMIGEQLGVSPMMIDNLVRGYGAGLGRYASDSIDFFLVKSNLRDAPVAPAKTWAEVPGVRAFFGSAYNGGPYMERFHNAMRTAEQRLGAATAYADIQDAKAVAWWEKNRNALVFYNAPVNPNAPPSERRTRMTSLRRIQQDLSDYNKALAQTYEDRNISAEEKRRRILALIQGRERLAQAGFELLHPGDRQDAW